MTKTHHFASNSWLKLLPLGLTLAILLAVGGLGLANEQRARTAPDPSLDPQSARSHSGSLVWTTEPIPVFADGEVPQEHQEALDAAHRYAEQFMLSESALFSQLTNETVGFSDEAARYAVAHCHGDWYRYAFTSAAVLAESSSRNVEQLSATLTGTQGFTRPQAAYATALVAAFQVATILA